MLPSVSLWDQNTSFAHLLGSPQKLWLHFASLITSPHAPFICPLSWKKVIGLEAVLTCFVGYGSENHSSGIPFSYKLLQFPVEVSHWVGVLPQVFRLFSVQWIPCRCSYQWAFWKRPVKWIHGTSGTWRLPESRLRSWARAAGLECALPPLIM